MFKKKALFLDRDGVLNQERGTCVVDVKDFKILKFNFPFFRKMYKENFLLLVISNQSCLDLKKLTLTELNKMHNKLKQTCRDEGFEITDIFFCPHHPKVSGKCLCRKPDSLLFEKAVHKYRINPNLSFMVGDKERDIKAAEKIGIKGILIGANRPVHNYFTNYFV